MKRVMFILACMAMIGCAGDNNGKVKEEMSNTKGELKAFDVQKEFADNGFTFFTKNLILCVGDSSESNAMTIGWGAIGNYLGHDRPAVTVYVAPARYTYEFLRGEPQLRQRRQRSREDEPGNDRWHMGGRVEYRLSAVL